jgi:hypothetical protein
MGQSSFATTRDEIFLTHKRLFYIFDLPKRQF